jgi:hypothetical protein
MARAAFLVVGDDVLVFRQAIFWRLVGHVGTSVVLQLHRLVLSRISSGILPRNTSSVLEGVEEEEEANEGAHERPLRSYEGLILG